MNNSDIPAMPVPGMSHDDDFNGLSKREYFMAHCAIDGDSLTLNNHDALEEFVGRKVDMESTQDIAMAQCEIMAKLKRMQVDADLAELERVGGRS